LPKQTRRPPMIRQPDPRYKPGAPSERAITKLMIRLQRRRTTSNITISPEFASKSLKMLLTIFFMIE
jgi:hypothetical protein